MAAVGAGAALLFAFLAGAPVARPARVPASPVSTSAVGPGAALPAPEPPAPGDAIDMAPVLADGGLRVLLRAEVDERWLAPGRPSVTVDDGLTVVTRQLSEAGHAEFAGAVGERVRLYRADGSSCMARVTDAIALGRFEDAGDAEPSHRPEKAWEKAADTHVIAGQLEPIAGSCDDTLWARSHSLPPPSIASRRPTAPEVRRAAIAAFESRPEYRELTDGSGSEEYEVSTLSTGDETVVVTVLVVEGCVGKWPALTALWRLEPGGSLSFLGAEESITGILVGADADGDGHLEILAQDDLDGVSLLRRRASSRYHVAAKAPVAIHGCRC